ncbi:MAG: c-type cytochrome [Terracidiphilus sp.]
MKSSSVVLLAAAAVPVSAILFILTPLSKAQQQETSTSAPAQVYPAPTNLQVLPKDLTGAQVRDIMEGWENDLGAECSTCHVRNPNDLGPNGRPRFNYADDSKEEKKTARVMYTMVDTINANFVSKVPNSGVPVNCGTCHRGHLSPEPFNGDDVQKPATPASTH